MAGESLFSGGQALITKVKSRTTESMEEEKRKLLEAKLNQLLSQHNQPKDPEIPERKDAHGIRLIRRRKGNPDKHIS